MRKGMGGAGMGSGSGIRPSKAKVCVETQTSVRLTDVSGIDEAKAELEKVVQFLRAPERFRRLGGKIPKGVQIVGDPGTGKRLLAKAVPAEVGVSFLSISGSKFVGVAAAERPPHHLYRRAGCARQGPRHDRRCWAALR